MHRLLGLRLMVLTAFTLAATGCCCMDFACPAGGGGHSRCADPHKSAMSKRPEPPQEPLAGPVPPQQSLPQPLAPPVVVSRFHPVPTRPVFAPR
jgi:hypothetical protein